MLEVQTMRQIWDGALNKKKRFIMSQAQVDNLFVFNKHFRVENDDVFFITFS